MYWYYKYKHTTGWQKVMQELQFKVQKFNPDWIWYRTQLKYNTIYNMWLWHYYCSLINQAISQ